MAKCRQCGKSYKLLSSLGGIFARLCDDCYKRTSATSGHPPESSTRSSVAKEPEEAAPAKVAKTPVDKQLLDKTRAAVDIHGLLEQKNVSLSERDRKRMVEPNRLLYLVGPVLGFLLLLMVRPDVAQKYLPYTGEGLIRFLTILVLFGVALFTFIKRR